MTSPSPLRLPWPLWAILVAIILPELVLMAADAGLIGSSRWRYSALSYGAFWAGILGDWRPNYTGQSFAMFFSYSFLHAGISHLAGNAAALVWLGPMVARQLRPWAIFVLYGASVLGGALAFGAMSTSASPMVGASGAVFGLAGAALVLACLDRPDKAWRWGLGGTGLLVALNALIWWIQDGQLAWETHLGGFVVGAALAWALPKRGSYSTASSPANV